MWVRRRETGSQDDGPTPAARPASRASSSRDPADDRGGMAPEGVLMRTLHESEWVPAAGEPEYPPHIGSGSFEPEPPIDENGQPLPEPEIVEPTPEPDQDPPPEPEADVAATAGEPAGDAEAPADPEPPAE